MILYFCVMWTTGFVLVWRLSRRYSKSEAWRYDMAVVQAFTAGSNNFVSWAMNYPTCFKVLTQLLIGTSNRSHDRSLRSGL